MIDPVAAREFLSHKRIVVAGASNEPKNFGGTIYKELKGRGYEVVAVNPKAGTVDGDPCYADLASVPGDVEGVIVMVPKDRSAEVVRACTARGVERVWLFQGIGGPGSVSDEAVQVCRENGITVVAGACPMMFLEPAGWFHRAHRTVRRMKGAIGKETAGAAASHG